MSRTRYQISTWNSDTSTEARAYVTRKRLDAAQTALWSAIYAMCEADGALAHRLLREFNAFCAEPHPLNGRYYFARDFVLRTDTAGKLQHVRFVAIRDDR